MSPHRQPWVPTGSHDHGQGYDMRAHGTREQSQGVPMGDNLTDLAHRIIALVEGRLEEFMGGTRRPQEEC